MRLSGAPTHRPTTKVRGDSLPSRKPLRQNPKTVAACTRDIHLVVKRRGVLAGGLAFYTCVLGHASARAGLLDGYVAFYKGRQRQNGGAKLLAPIRAAHQRLAEAAGMLEEVKPFEVQPLMDVIGKVRASSLNCYVFEPFETDSLETRASIITQQLQLADPCTFRIIVKNVAGLESLEVQRKAEEELDALILSYQMLDDLLDMALEGNVECLEKAKVQIRSTLQAVESVEGTIQGILTAG